MRGGEAEKGGEPRRGGFNWAEIVPMHPSWGQKARIQLKKKKKKKKKKEKKKPQKSKFITIQSLIKKKKIFK